MTHAVYRPIMGWWAEHLTVQEKHRLETEHNGGRLVNRWCSRVRGLGWLLFLGLLFVPYGTDLRLACDAELGLCWTTFTES